MTQTPSDSGTSRAPDDFQQALVATPDGGRWRVDFRNTLAHGHTVLDDVEQGAYRCDGPDRPSTEYTSTTWSPLQTNMRSKQLTLMSRFDITISS